MSYIRTTSNPEHLYIAGLEDGVHLAHSVKPPLASKWPSDGNHPLIIIPHRAFNAACKAWEDSDQDETVTCYGFSVREVHVRTSTGKPMLEFNMRNFRRYFACEDHEFLIRLDYKGQFVHLWRVTWDCVVRNTLEQT